MTDNQRGPVFRVGATGNVQITCFEDEGRTWVSWWVRPGHRGRGLGTEALRSFLATETGERWAMIRPWNRASIALAERAGFVLAEATEENLTYRWTPGGAK